MKKLTMALFACALAAGALADEAADLKKNVQSAMDQASKAMMKKDMAGAEKILRQYFAKDFKNTDLHGKTTTLEQWLGEMKAQMPMVKSIDKMNLKCVSVKVHGDHAVCQESMEMVMTMPNPQDPKKTSQARQGSTSESHMEKRHGKWWVVSSKDKTSRMWFDGKEMKM